MIRFTIGFASGIVFSWVLDHYLKKQAEKEEEEYNEDYEYATPDPHPWCTHEKTWTTGDEISETTRCSNCGQTWFRSKRNP